MLNATAEKGLDTNAKQNGTDRRNVWIQKRQSLHFILFLFFLSPFFLGWRCGGLGGCVKGPFILASMTFAEVICSRRMASMTFLFLEMPKDLR